MGDLIDVDSGEALDAIHTGLTINQETGAVYATLGNQAGGSRDEVALLDPDTAEVTVVATDVFAVEELVGAEPNPCTGELVVVRNGDRLLAIDLATGVEREIATLTVEVDGEDLPVATDNLAVRRLDCAAGCTRTIGYYGTHGCDPKGRNENEIQPLLGSDSVWLGQPDPDDPDEARGDSVLVRESCADDEQVLAWKDALDGYNNGVTGPGSCDDRDDEDDRDGEDDRDDEDDRDGEDDHDDRDDRNDEDDRGRGRGRGRGRS